MNELEQALSQISEVRAQLAAATRFRGLAPHAVALSGLLAVAAALVQTSAPDRFNGTASAYVLFWTGVAVASAAVIASEAFIRSRSEHGVRAGILLDSALRLLLPALGGGAAVTFVLWRTAPEVLWVLPGLWEVFIALAAFSAQAMLTPQMRWAGFFYLAAGIASLVIARGQPSLSPWLMGLPFGAGQLLAAAILYRSGAKP